jgi:hypothetical protein
MGIQRFLRPPAFAPAYVRLPPPRKRNGAASRRGKQKLRPGWQIAPAFAGPMAGKQISQRIGNYLFFNSRHAMD